jgi:hypothetical protein
MVEFDVEDVDELAGYTHNDIETNEEGDVIGHGGSAHYLHREAEKYEVSRAKVTNTYNRMTSLIEPEKISYDYLIEERPKFPNDGELETAAEMLSKGESIESSATKALKGHLLRKKTGKREIQH